MVDLDGLVHTMTAVIRFRLLVRHFLQGAARQVLHRVAVQVDGIVVLGALLVRLHPDVVLVAL